MNWIRIATNIGDDPRIETLAEDLRVRVAEAVGLVVLVLVKLPANAPDGNISAFRDARIEKWAGWHGRAGVFGAAFRAVMCDSDIVRAWDKHNGRALEKAERNAERARQWRLAHEAERERLADEKLVQARSRMRSQMRSETDSETHPVREAEHMNVTRRNETIRDELLLTTNNNNPATPELPAGTVVGAIVPKAKPPKPPPKFPHFPMALCQEMHAMWCEGRGGILLPQFRATFGTLFTRPESERPPEAPTNAELKAALKAVIDLAGEGSGAPYLTAANVAQRLAGVAKVRREHAEDPLARLAAIERILHGTPPRRMAS